MESMIFGCYAVRNITDLDHSDHSTFEFLVISHHISSLACITWQKSNNDLDFGFKIKRLFFHDFTSSLASG